MHVGPFIGVGGDVATFVGGLVLAFDALNREKEFGRIRTVTGTALRTGALARLKIDLNGVILTDEDDIERAFIRQSARKAIWGCGFLAVGFLLLLSAHLIELWN
jgi:hypothetical protein